MEVIIWTNKRVDLTSVMSVLQEDPDSGLLHPHDVVVKIEHEFNSEFFLDFCKSLRNAGVVPQYHVIILDGRTALSQYPYDYGKIHRLMEIFGCVVDQIQTRKMKFLMFYELKNEENRDQVTKMKNLSYEIRASLINPSSDILRYVQHEGSDLSYGTKFGTLTKLPLTLLARSLVRQVKNHLTMLPAKKQ